mmetsp:Transcript_88444/g.250620  ORF Transcript_88444/g.250620 Transcript_88444/m.250620 type:complete len:225 (-) Transcript_88444:294-968(-)
MRTNSSSPCSKEMALTMHLPCVHFRPSSITGHFIELRMNGTFATLGSAAHRCMNLPIAHFASIVSESKLKSSMSASCFPQNSIAASHLFSLVVHLYASTSPLNLCDPATLQRWLTTCSPASASTVWACKLESCMAGFLGGSGSRRGAEPFSLELTAETCAGWTTTRLIFFPVAHSSIWASGLLPPALADMWHQLRLEPLIAPQTVFACALPGEQLMPTDIGLAC